MNLGNYFAELKLRNVYKVAAGILITIAMLHHWRRRCAN